MVTGWWHWYEWTHRQTLEASPALCWIWLSVSPIKFGNSIGPWSSAWIETMAESCYPCREVLSNTPSKTGNYEPTFLGMPNFSCIFRGTFCWTREKSYCRHSAELICMRKYLDRHLTDSTNKQRREKHAANNMSKIRDPSSQQVTLTGLMADIRRVLEELQ
jgi:hypothetical protein